MAEYPYTQVTGKLRALLLKIREVGKPTKVTNAWLKSLGFSSSNDGTMVGVLRFIDFIDASNSPTQKWSDYRGGTHKIVLAQAIRDAYSQLYSIYPDADARSQQELENVVRSSSSGGAQVITKTVNTFKTLVAEADFQSTQSAPSGSTPLDPPTPASLAPLASVPVPTPAINGGPALHIDIQIHISSDASAKQIDQIFSSMAKHLYPSK